MQNLAPKIFRQRLLIEAVYDTDVDKGKILRYFKEMAKELGVHIYSQPIVHETPLEKGKERNAGYDAFAPLFDSGISLYVWTNVGFLSVIVYTCKKFDPAKAIAFTKKFFNTQQMEHMEF